MRLGVTGLRVAITFGVITLEVYCDSSLVVNQVNCEYVARDSRMAEYLQLALHFKSKIPRCDFKSVPRSNLGAATEFQFICEILLEHIINPNIQQPTGEILRLDTPGRRDTIIVCLKDGTLPDDKTEARKLQHWAT